MLAVVRTCVVREASKTGKPDNNRITAFHHMEMTLRKSLTVSWLPRMDSNHDKVIQSHLRECSGRAPPKPGIKIIYLKMGYKPDLSDLGAPNSVNRVRHLRLGVGEKITAPNGSESRILIRDTWNTDIVSELKPQLGDDVVCKTRFSGFFETDLDTRLKKLGLTHLIITGCTTSICVDSNRVRDAMFRDYLCVLLADCMSEPIGHALPQSNHYASLLSAEMALGWVSDSERILKAVQP
jgi:ureidoacrylate peracid hydrolase